MIFSVANFAILLVSLANSITVHVKNRNYICKMLNTSKMHSNMKYEAHQDYKHCPKTSTISTHSWVLETSSFGEFLMIFGQCNTYYMQENPLCCMSEFNESCFDKEISERERDKNLRAACEDFFLEKGLCFWPSLKSPYINSEVQVL